MSLVPSSALVVQQFPARGSQLSVELANLMLLRTRGLSEPNQLDEAMKKIGAASPGQKGAGQSFPCRGDPCSSAWFHLPVDILAPPAPLIPANQFSSQTRTQHCTATPFSWLHRLRFQIAIVLLQLLNLPSSCRATAGGSVITFIQPLVRPSVDI